MDCASEESEIRRAVAGIAGIRAMTFQLGERTMALDAAPAVVEQALAAIRKTGFDPQPVTAAATPGRPSAAGGEDEHDHAADAGGLRRLGFALVLAVGAELVGFLAPDTRIWQGVGLAVAAVAIWLAGIDVYRKGLTALFRGRLNINALMTVAVTGAFVIGQWPEAAMVMVLYAIAEAIEAKAVDRARNAIKGLLAMAPEEAAVRQADGSWLTVPVADVALNSVVRVRPGERGGALLHLLLEFVVGSAQVRQGSPPPSMRPACSNSKSRRPRPTPRWPGSFTRSKKRKARALRRRVSSIVSRPSTRRACSCSRWRWRCSDRGCSTGPGCRRPTKRWFCWSSPVRVRW